MKAFVTIVQHLDPNMFGVAQDQDQCRRWVASHWVQCSKVNEIEREGEEEMESICSFSLPPSPSLSTLCSVQLRGMK